MRCVITQLYKKHNIWLGVVQSLGVNKDTAKDIVSEMYINIQTLINDNRADIYYNKDEINYYFIYLCLRNLVFDLKRKEKKVTYTNIENCKLEAEDEEYIETPDNYKKFEAILDWYENPEYLEMLENDTVLQNFSSDKMHVYYLRRIFKEVYLEGQKLAKFSRDTKITYWSLRNTLKTVKHQIKKNYENRNGTRKNI
jgi:hypothetical protein